MTGYESARIEHALETLEVAKMMCNRAAQDVSAVIGMEEQWDALCELNNQIEARTQGLIKAREHKRNLERDQAAARCDLPSGALVYVRLDDGSVMHTFTKSEPWRLGNGDWLVLLDGVVGGYDLSRVTPAPATTTMEA